MTAKEIIEDLRELKSSIYNHTIQNEQALRHITDRMSELAKIVESLAENIPHQASQGEVNGIFKD